MSRTAPSTAALICVAGSLVAWPGSAGAAPPAIERRTIVVVEVRPLTAERVGERADRPLRLVLDSEDDAGALVELGWPTAADRSRMTFRVAHAPAVAGSERAVALDARLVLPDGTSVHASRTIAFDENETTLFEIHRFDDRSLTLAVELATESELVVSSRLTPGSPIRFRLEIVRVLDGRSIPLENDYLNTLIGEEVSYAFRLADTADADSVSITIAPRRLVGDIAEIDISVSGKLPVGDELMIIGRTERWLASRDATSTLAFEAGQPPTGYRFLLTARF
ncbi:MAG TPA: hypothetical protein VD788_11620 [Candidatus Polarisedimenticolaceae bacterium]|nr:hypothetical protein [Candidatus Polarisedimenticolaceae bacterium]